MTPERKEEFNQAFACLASELEIEQYRLWSRRELFELSLGRVYWKLWSRQDAIDPEWIEDPRGQYQRIDGWPEQHADRSDPMIRLGKWTRRAVLWAAWHYDAAQHVIDWLHVAVEEAHPWLSNLDALGRPKKLMKCGSLEQLVTEADKAMRRRRVSLDERARSLGMDDESFEMDLGAGHTLVRLLSPAALDVESARMKHCIGHGAYDERLTSPDYEYYSIRDADGRPQATLELRRARILDGLAWTIRQFRAASNARPDEYLADLIEPVCGERGWWGLGFVEQSTPGYGPEAAVILRDLPPPPRRP